MAVSDHSVYSGNLTGGSLLVRESRIVARMLVAGDSPDDIQSRIMDQNLFQNDSAATTRKYCRLIFSRFSHVTPEQLHIVACGSDESAALMLLAVVLKTYPIVRDFVDEVLCDKARSFDTHLEKKDWTRFLEQRETIDPDVKRWTESSRKKIGQVIIRMLSEAGLLSDTRHMQIQFPNVPFDVSDSLLQAVDASVLECLRLGKAA
ncbi:MAG: DUF1819 family protein [Kiritimatiellia bacterium]